MTTSAHGSFAPGGFCCPSHPRSSDPIRQARWLPRTSQVRWLYRGSLPDDLIWTASEAFPALGQRSFLACHHPYAERRNGDIPETSLLPEAFHNTTGKNYATSKNYAEAQSRRSTSQRPIAWNEHGAAFS